MNQGATHEAGLFNCMRRTQVSDFEHATPKTLAPITVFSSKIEPMFLSVAADFKGEIRVEGGDYSVREENWATLPLRVTMVVERVAK